MDDGNKMKNSEIPVKDKREVALFLGDEGKQLRAGGEVSYDLVTEYQKTRKNRSLLVPLVLGIVVLLVTGISWAITYMINQGSKKVEVDISSFEDLNLRDLLDTTKRYSDELDKATRELVALEADLKGQLDTIAEKRLSDLSVLEAMQLDEAEIEQRRRVIDNEAASETRKVNNTLLPAIEAKRLEIEGLQEKLASYDSRAVEEARKQQETLDNQQRLNELEKQQLTSFYEERIEAMEKALEQEKIQSRRALDKAINDLTNKHRSEIAQLTDKYNPTWEEDDPLNAVISATVQRRSEKDTYPMDLREPPGGSAVDAENVQSFSAAYNDLRYTMERLGKVPYINSIPPSITAADSAGSVLGREYLLLLNSSAKTIRDRNTYIDELENSLDRTTSQLDSMSVALTDYIRSVNAAGIVVDSGQPDSIYLFIDPQYAAEAVKGRTAWIFRGDDEPIAETRLDRDGELVLGKVVSLEEGRNIRVYDKVLLDLTNRLEVRP